MIYQLTEKQKILKIETQFSEVEEIASTFLAFSWNFCSSKV